MKRWKVTVELKIRLWHFPNISMLCFNTVNENLLQCLCGPQPMQLRDLCVLYYADILHCNTYGLSLLLK